MKSQLCILHLEDDPGDASLVQAMLQTAGFTCQTFTIPAALHRRGSPSVVRSDAASDSIVCAL